MARVHTRKGGACQRVAAECELHWGLEELAKQSREEKWTLPEDLGGEVAKHSREQDQIGQTQKRVKGARAQARGAGVTCAGSKKCTDAEQGQEMHRCSPTPNDICVTPTMWSSQLCTHQKITQVFLCRLTQHYMSHKALHDI